MQTAPTVIDLFCGAGGLSKGFEQAGFEVVFGTDIDATYGETFGQSHKSAIFVAKPIQELAVDTIRVAAGLGKAVPDVLIGGPPCQGYSVYNHGRGVHDPRAGLFREYLRIVRDLRPNWLVMENVTGLLSINEGRLVDTILEGIRELGYADAEFKVLRAEDYGVPQERRRVVFIANRIGIPIHFPEPSHGQKNVPFTTVWDAIGDLNPVFEHRDFAKVAYACGPQNAYQREMRGTATVVANHFGPRLGKVNEERVRHIPQGGSWRDIPPELLPEGMKRAKRSDHTKRYGRPRPDSLSCTILTKCDIHWGAFLHPIQNRPFTVREAARLQSFPDDFEFFGSMTEQFVQVGNAVPPKMARAIGSEILAAISPRQMAA